MRSLSPTWRHILLIWLVGVLAAAQLGKFAALATVIHRDLSLSLVATGWLVSLIETGGATLGLVAGLLIGRLGSRRALLSGLCLLTVAGLAQGLSPSALTLFAARIVESAGYLTIVIAAPSLIGSIAPPKDQAAALTLWSTFVPAGFALGMTLSGAGLLVNGWHGVLLGWGVMAGAVWLACLRTPLPEIRTPGRFAIPGLAAWGLSIGFGFYAAIFTGIIALLPAYLVEVTHLSPSAAATVTGIASATTLGGAVVAGLVLKRGHVSWRWAAMTAGLLIPAALSFLVFNGGTALKTGGVAIMMIAISGVPSSIVFARLPYMFGRNGQPPNMAAVNGVLTQFGAGGSLIGAPLLAFIVGHAGWGTVAIAILAGLSASLVLSVWAETVAARNRAAAPH